MKLRYVFVFLLGMAVMYWLVRADLVVIDREDVVVTGEVMTGIVDQSWVDSTTIQIDTGADSLSDTQSTGTTTSELVDEVIETITGAATDVQTGSSDPVPSTLVHSKQTACAQPNGSYTQPLAVSWNGTMTASTSGYVKLGGFVHYVVFVSDGSKYYFYHNCSTNAATNARVLSDTPLSRVVLRSGQVYLD